MGMSSITLNGDTSGSVQILVPAVAGSNTVTIAAQTGTLNAAGPAFSAYQSSTQSLSNGVATKIQFQTKYFDTNNNFDAATNYRFTPTVAGYYYISGATRLQIGSSSTGEYWGAIYKNGSEYARGGNMALNTNAFSFWQVSVSDVIQFNGSTDYVEFYAIQGSGSSQTTVNSAALTFFSGCLLRGA